MPSQVQWAKLSEFLLQVGAFDEPVPFCVNALERLGKVVSFDQGRVYLYDGQSNVFDEYLLGIKKETTRIYHEYYSDVDDGRYSATKRAAFEAKKLKLSADKTSLPQGMRVRRQEIIVLDWSKEPHDTKFYREYAGPLGLTYCTGFQLFDHEGSMRALFCIDRTRPVDFNADERALLSLVATHLDNMYRKLFVEPPAPLGDTISLMASGIALTERERQLCTMLMRGETPKTIAESLGISRRTVYKHVSNIHRKLGVSSEAELLAKLSAAAVRGRGEVLSNQS